LCNENVIVSGLADGVDFEAHLAAVENRGKTIAILGQGVNMISSQPKRDLAEKIIETGGLIVTEHFPDELPTKFSFLNRNRLQSALSEKVFVIESEEKGGTMYTAKKALEQKKELYVFKSKDPQWIMPSGNKKLIEEGARIFDEDLIGNNT